MRQMNSKLFASTCLAFAVSIGGLTTLTGCPDREVSEVLPAQDKVEGKKIPVSLNRDVDILFVIDNSGSMKEEQTSLTANFSKFVDVLRSIDGGLPNVHIGVVTSDMGTANGGSAGGCAGNGDNGVMKTGGVTFTGGVNYLSDVADPANPGMRITNYGSETLTSAFTKMATVGTSGCGFEQHLASAVAGLNSPANAGFLRDSAFLAIVVIADEDDCSMKQGGMLLSNDAALGPLQSFRCSEHGVICDGPDNMRNPGVRTNCKPRETSAYETKIADLVAAVKAKKGARADKNIIVAGITAPSEPFSVGRDTSMTPAIPKMDPACTYNAPGGMTQRADAAVRLNAFLASFRNNSQTTICKEDLSDALFQIGLQLKAVIGTPCFDAKLADPIDCTVSDITNFGEANESEKLMPACNAGKTNVPCWHIDTDAAKCPAPATGKIIVFERGGTVPPTGTVTSVACATVK